MKKYCKKYKESYGEIKSYRLSERYYDPCKDEYVFIGVNPLGKKRTVGKISRERIIAADIMPSRNKMSILRI